MPFSVAVAMATVKLEGLAPPKKYFFKTVIILNYHVKFQVDITNIKEKVSAHRCLALSQVFYEVLIRITLYLLHGFIVSYLSICA